MTTTKLDIRMIEATIYATEPDNSFSMRHVELRLPDPCTVQQAIAALAAFELRHSDGEQTTKPMSEVDARLPEGICGALDKNTEACVFTPHTEGTPHSWEAHQ